MTKLTKRVRMMREKVSVGKQYSIDEAISLLKEIAHSKFIESVDVAINLGIDARKSDQSIRGIITLPHGTGRSVRVAVFAQGQHAEDAKISGAEMVGMEDLAEQISRSKTEFDVVIASPEAMRIVSKLGQILGPRGLMPNPKTGTVTDKISEAVKNAKSGQIRYRNDKNGIIHSTIGRVSFSDNKLKENLESLIIALKRMKPPQVKGMYIRKISVSTTMGCGISVEPSSLRYVVEN